MLLSALHFLLCRAAGSFQPSGGCHCRSSLSCWELLGLWPTRYKGAEASRKHADWVQFTPSCLWRPCMLVSLVQYQVPQWVHTRNACRHPPHAGTS